MEKGDFVRARMGLEAAEWLDPGRPEVAFAAARVAGDLVLASFIDENALDGGAAVFPTDAPSGGLQSEIVFDVIAGTDAADPTTVLPGSSRPDVGPRK